MTYEEQYNFYLKKAETALEKSVVKVLNCNINSKVAKAANYSLMAGGKRVRAVLCIAVCDMLNGDIELAAQYASAVEMLHCYSLIHDDLPCMDDDDYRRGKPSCHKKYGEATALLAGDALLTAAFEVLSTANGKPEQNANACSILSSAAGARGMIYGQELDLQFENSPASENELLEIHKNKTGMLINAAAELGVICAGNVLQEHKNTINKFAFNVGLVFQIVDDILDVTASEEVLGKPIGSDDKSNKTTFIKLFGLQKYMASEYTNYTCNLLKTNFELKAEFLIEFANRLLIREK